MYEITGTVVRPSARVLWIIGLQLALPAVASAIWMLVRDPGRLWLAAVILLVVLAPILASMVVSARNTRLLGRGTDLVLINERGRELVVPAADLTWAGFVLVTRHVDGITFNRRLAMTRGSGAPPLVIDATPWNQDEVRGLLAGLGVEVQPGTASLTLQQLCDMLPGYHPPFLHRHQTLVGLAALMVVWLVTVIVAIVGVIIALTVG